jgi:hypothetical protein
MQTKMVSSVVVSVLSVLISANIPAQGTERKTEHVVVVAIDGARWQDVFGAGRDTLMPFLWGVVAKQGQLFGNRDVGSRMRVTNRMNFSYPGYNEMLAGYVDPRIDNNRFGPNPNVTVLEWLNRQPALRGRVAAFANWVTFDHILARRDTSFVVRAGGLRGEPTIADATLHRLAMSHLADRKPRVLFIGFGETDTWAHAGNVDRYRAALRDADRFLSELWQALQAGDYRGTTTLIVSTDHGRGRGRQWVNHSWRTRGSAETWLAIMGPDTPALGERRDIGEVTTAQIAATIAAALGYDYRADVPRAAPPIPSR